MLRSYLYAPGNNEDLVRKVFSAGADAVVLDLEDAVPVPEKERARALVVNAIRDHRKLGLPEIHVRINRIEGMDAARDIEAVVVSGVTCLRLPKVETQDEVREAADLVGVAEEAAAIRRGQVGLCCLVESVEGFLNVRAICSSERVRHLAFGAEDFVADAGMDPSPGETELLPVKLGLVLESRRAGIEPPVGSVHTRLDDEEGLRRTSLELRRLGFGGRSAIHPRQLEPIHDVFTPTQADVHEAWQIVKAYQEAVSAGRAATSTASGQFIDSAVMRRAKRTLSLRESIGLSAPHEEGSSE